MEMEMISRQNARTIAAVTLMVCLVLTVQLESKAAKNGAFILDWNGMAPQNSLVHILATSQNDFTFNQVYDVSGMYLSEALDHISSDLQMNGWYAKTNGSSEIQVMGRIAGSSLKSFGTHASNGLTPASFAETGPPVEESAPVNSHLSAYTQLTTEGTDPGSFDFLVSAPIVDPEEPPTLYLSVNGAEQAVIQSPGFTVADVLSSIESSFTTMGFATQAAEGSVSIPWNDPSNSAMLGSEVKVEVGVLGGAGGPHITLILPGESITSEFGIVTYPEGNGYFAETGGELKYFFGIGNDGNAELLGDVWTEVSDGTNETQYFQNLPSYNYMLESSESYSEEMLLEIPMDLPNGTYTVTTYFKVYSSEESYNSPDEFQVKQSSFQFTKMGNLSPLDRLVKKWASNEYEVGNFGNDVIPTKMSLNGYPNPFNPETQLSFDLPESSQLSLQIYDIAGREVATLVNGYFEAGSHNALFDAQALPSGVYFARLSTPQSAATLKLMLLK